VVFQGEYSASLDYDLIRKLTGKQQKAKSAHSTQGRQYPLLGALGLDGQSRGDSANRCQLISDNYTSLA